MTPFSERVRLADAGATVPWPGVPGRLLPSTPFSVSPLDPFFSALLADGTLVRSPEEGSQPDPAPEPEPKPSARPKP